MKEINILHQLHKEWGSLCEHPHIWEKWILNLLWKSGHQKWILPEKIGHSMVKKTHCFLRYIHVVDKHNFDPLQKHWMHAWTHPPDEYHKSVCHNDKCIHHFNEHVHHFDQPGVVTNLDSSCWWTRSSIWQTYDIYLGGWGRRIYICRSKVFQCSVKILSGLCLHKINHTMLPLPFDKKPNSNQTTKFPPHIHDLRCQVRINFVCQCFFIYYFSTRTNSETWL
jgi:hypothetical protein